VSVLLRVSKVLISHSLNYVICRWVLVHKPFYITVLCLCRLCYSDWTLITLYIIQEKHNSLKSASYRVKIVYLCYNVVTSFVFVLC